ncbi:MAG: hypothetical protein MJ118_00590 [Clostridia bacterium]|nr:hypothetical protein [Clostridia bacterium]
MRRRKPCLRGQNLSAAPQARKQRSENLFAGHATGGVLSLRGESTQRRAKENRVVFFGIFPFYLQLSAPDRRLDSLPTGGRSLAAMSAEKFVTFGAEGKNSRPHFRLMPDGG